MVFPNVSDKLAVMSYVEHNSTSENVTHYF